MIRFGVAGHSESFLATKGTTLDSANWYAERGVDLLEYSFGRGVNIGTETAKSIGKAFEKAGVGLSAHAPYYVNFANTEADMIEKSIGYVLRSAEKVKLFGGDRVIVHPATQGKLTREKANALMLDNAKLLIGALDEANLSDIKICWETMGKTMQMGTVEEIVGLCALDPHYYPCVDFGHVNAREQGILKTTKNYNSLIQYMLDYLPREKVEQMHVHFSKIQYGPKGEIRHLTFSDREYGPEFEPLAEVFLLHRLEPTIVCESAGTQTEDCLEMKRIYFEKKKEISA